MRFYSTAIALVMLAAVANPAAASALVPSGEAKTMDGHDVDLGALRFRPGKGLEFVSQDGDFRLSLRLRGQILYTVLFSDGEDPAQQFRLRRARVAFGGHFFGKNNTLKIELAVSPNDLGVGDNFDEDPLERLPAFSPLLDLYFEFRHIRDLTLRIGQYKLPGNRSRVVSSGNMQLVDRSIVNGEFNIDRDIGFDLRSPDLLGLDMFRYYAGISLGRGRDSQGFDDFGMNYFLRLEYLPFGMFDDYSEADFERSLTPHLSVGVVYVYQDRNRGLRGITSRLPADGGTTDHHLFIADLIFKWAGLSAQWEFAYRRGTRNPGSNLDDMGILIAPTAARNGWGTSFQTGYLIPRLPLEFAARFAVVRAVGGATSLSDGNELGGGANWYFARHPFKLQADVFQLWSDAIGEGSTQVRVQLQGSF